MFTALRQLQVHGVQAAFINYVVCLAVVKGIKEATQHLLPVCADGWVIASWALC